MLHHGNKCFELNFKTFFCFPAVSLFRVSTCHRQQVNFFLLNPFSGVWCSRSFGVSVLHLGPRASWLVRDQLVLFLKTFISSLVRTGAGIRSWNGSQSSQWRSCQSRGGPRAGNGESRNKIHTIFLLAFSGILDGRHWKGRIFSWFKSWFSLQKFLTFSALGYELN